MVAPVSDTEAVVERWRAVTEQKLKKEVARWPRSSVRIGDLSEGRLAYGLVLRAGDRTIPCRTPKMGGNPAARAVIEALGDRSPNAAPV